MPLRSSDLSLYLERCPAAVAHRRAGTPIDRDGFATGIAAHAMLQALGEAPTGTDPEPIIDRAAHVLLTQGRSFDGAPEPPLPPDAVLDARRLALRAWFSWPFPDGAKCEHGFAIDAAGCATTYTDPAALARGIIDLIYPATIEVDGEPIEGVCVRDYKSAWSAGDDDMPEADSRSRTRRQMRLYALFAVAAHPEAQFVRLEIANLRTTAIGETTIWLNDAGRATLDQWLAEVRILAAALDATPPTPRPGAGCPGCPYVRACEPSRHIIGQDDATRYVALQAERDALRAVLLAAGRTHALPDGSVGYVEIETRRPRPDALIEAARRFGAVDAPTVAFLAKLKPTMGAVNDAVAALVPTRRGDAAYKAERVALVDALTVPAIVSEFKIIKSEP